MSDKDLTGIICSQDLSEAYCLEGSSFQKQLDEKNIITIYIPNFMLNHLVHESFEGNCFKWNVEKVLEYRKD